MRANHPQMETRPFALSLLAALAGTFTFLRHAEGRAPYDLPYEELSAKSHVVALLEPLENTPAPDILSDNGNPSANFVAVTTRFKIHAVLRGNLTAAHELIVLHFY